MFIEIEFFQHKIDKLIEKGVVVWLSMRTSSGCPKACYNVHMSTPYGKL